jgi:phosphate transport system substrate-binding protein
VASLKKAIVSLSLAGLIFAFTISFTAAKEISPRDLPADLHKTAIAKDEVVLIVNKSNPVNNLSLAQVQKIYCGEYTNWKDVGGPDLKIVVINRETSSNIRSRFETQVLGKKLINTGNCLIQSSTGSIQLAVAFTKQAIGYLSFTSLNSKVVRAIVIGNQSLPVKKVVTNEILPPKTAALKKTYLTKSF